MSDVQAIWDDADDPDGNVAHIAEHGLTPAEVEDVLLDDTIREEVSRSSGRPCKFGHTSTGRFIIVVFDEQHDDPRMLYPITAYEVPEPA